jgi:hypothetical protein
MKGLAREEVISKRIERMLQNHDENVFKYMDLVSKVFSPRESARLLGKYLVKITQDHKNMLKDYIDFYKSRNFHMTLPEYYAQLRNLPFPGFKPEHVEKSMQIANENGWIEECSIIFEYFVANMPAGTSVEGVRSAIKNGRKLNFSGTIANRIKQIGRIGVNAGLYVNSWLFSQWVDKYLAIEQLKTTDLMKVLHAVTATEAAAVLSHEPSHLYNRCRAISFIGSRLVKYYFRYGDPYHRIFHLEIRKSAATFTGLVPAPEHCNKVYLYHYYRAIVENDIERAEQIQLDHAITKTDLADHPHPLEEYLQYADQLNQKMVDYVVENFGGVPRCLVSFSHNPILDERWEIIRRLIAQGAIVHNIVQWNRLFYDKIPRNGTEFKALLDSAHPPLHHAIVLALCENCIKYGKISETKVLLLLAWKYGGGQNFLSILPKEIFKSILEFADEPPLLLQYAQIVVDMHRETFVFANNLSERLLASTNQVTRFIRDNTSKFFSPWVTMQSYPNKAIKRDVAILRQIILASTENNYIPERILKYFIKFETDEKVLQRLEEVFHLGGLTHIPILEYAVIYKNIKFLHIVYQRPNSGGRVLNEERFNDISLKRRTKISFQEAKDLLDQVRRKYFII